MAEVIVQEESLVTVADAIREKTGGTEGLVFPTGFAEAISGISGGGFPNGTEWTQSNVTIDAITNVVYKADGLWLAGVEDSLYYSTNGKEWIKNESVNFEIRRILYNNGLWVATATNGIYYSEDGMTWTQSNIAGSTSGDTSGICYANCTWVVGGNKTNGFFYSTDGKTWSKSNITTDKAKEICYYDCLWVAGSSGGKGIYYSEDGMTWTQSNINSGYIYFVNKYKGIWFAGNASKLYCSEDGITWTESSITSGNVKYGNGLLLANANYSTDGVTWLQSDTPYKDYFGAHYYANGIWINRSTKGHGLFYSTDGITWSRSNIDDKSFNSVYYSDGLWVAGSVSSGLYYSVAWEPTS